MISLPKIGLIALLLLASLTTHAETQTVTLLTDDGDEVCDANCTLRDAIFAAAASPGPSEIVFQAGLTGTITLTSDLTFFGDDTTINGPGAKRIAVSGDDQFIAMEISSSNDNGTVRGLTIRDGFQSGSASGAGLIARGNNMLLEDLRIIDNHNSGQGAGVLLTGGGTLRRTEISGNSGTLVTGLVVNGTMPVLVENVTISGNTAVQQTGIMYVLTNSGQDVIVRYVTVANNTGGSLAVNISNPGGSTIVESSIFAGNSASGGDLDVSSDTAVNNTIVENMSGSIDIGANNLIGVDPALLPLGFVSGSSTKVHRFGEDSAAFDHVDNVTGDPQCGTGVTTDQVGNPRPGGALCDAGAYEVRPGVLIDEGFE